MEGDYSVRSAACEEVAPVNDQVPLLLTDEAPWKWWLDPEIKSRAPLKQLMRPMADGVLLSQPYVAV